MIQYPINTCSSLSDAKDDKSSEQVVDDLEPLDWDKLTLEQKKEWLIANIGYKKYE